MQEAGELAKNTAILMNVSEFDNVNDATSALISTLQAFNYSAADSLEIVDKLNIVGNNFAISSDGIAEGLQRSASTLVAAGNSLEQSIAMLAAGNKVMQDPEALGNALKVLSMRIRGTKTELEEAGESTDGMAENTSKLRKQVMALTNIDGNGGIDILTEDGAFRSTYDILYDIAQIWDKLNDYDPKAQAALLELLAGKTRGSQLAAILQNPEDLKAAYETAMNSAGSAMKENERYLDSIQGKIDLFTNSLQAFWMDAISSDFIKNIVNAGTIILDILDKIVQQIGIILPLATGLLSKNWIKTSMNKRGIDGVSGLFSSIGKSLIDASGAKPFIDQIKQAFTVDAGAQINKMWAQGVADYSKYAEVIKSLNAAKQAEVLVNSKLTESEQLSILTRNLGSEAAAKQALAEAQLSLAQDKVALSQIGQLVNTGALTTAQAALLVSTLGLSGAEDGLTEITKAEALAKIQAAVAAGTLSAADAEAIISTLGLNTAVTTGVVGFKAFAVAVLNAAKAVAKFLLTDPVGWLILATGAIAGIVALYNKFGPSHNKFVKDLEEETQELNDVRAKLKDLNSELETTKQRIDELESKGSLSFVEDQELKKLKETSDELKRQIKLEEARESRALQKQLTAGLNAAKTDANLKDEYGVYGTNENVSSYAAVSGGVETTNIGNKYEQNLKKLENAKKELDEASAKLNEAVEKNNDDIKDNDIDTNSKEFKQLEKNVADAQKKVDDFNGQLDTLHNSFTETYGDIGYQKILDTDSEALKQLKEQWNALYRQQQMYQNKQALLNGTFTKADVIADVFGSTGATAAQEFNKSFSEKVEKESFNGLAEGTEYAQEWMNKLKDTSPQLAQELEYCGITAEDVAGYFMKVGEYAELAADKISTTVTSLDKLKSTIESYNSALEIANDITFDGQGISEDYYNALKEYLGDVTVGEEDFSDAIDTTNGYIVKNTTLLKKLISQKKAEAKATVSAVKSQGQLQYVKLTKQLQQEVAQLAKQYKANKAVTLSTVQNVSALRSQLEALKLTIKQYALLELQLSEATNAYDKFQKAKDFDSQLTYGDSLIEGIQALNDGFATGQVGTETFKAAVDMIVPPEAYESLDNYEDRLIAIHDYVDKNPLFADWFTVDEDGNFGIEFKNMAAFVQDMQKMGVFTGDDVTGFNFAEDIFTDDSVSAIDKIVAKTKEFNNGVGVTKETIVAMMTELSKYDARWGDLLTELTSTPLDREINNATDALAEATSKQEAFIRSGGDLNSDEYKQLVTDVNNASSALEQATQKAQQNAQTTVQCETMYDAMTGKIKLTQGAADALAKSLGLIDEQNPTITVNEDGTVTLTQTQLDKLNQTKASLSEASTMDIQGNFDQITKDLAALEQYKKDLENDPNATIKINGVEIKGAEEAQAKIDALTAEREEISIKYNITKTSDDSQTVLERLDEISINGYTIPVKADATEAHKTVDEVDADNPKDKTTTIEADDQATPVVDDYISKLDEIPDTVTTTIVTNKKTNYSWSFGKSDEEPEHALGTAHAIGNINSDGSLQKEEQNAIVGEIGPELVVDAQKGVYYTVGDNGTEMVNLPKGAIIYNHKQTEELLKNGKINSRGKYTGGLSFANGTAHAVYSDGYKHGLFGGYLSDDSVFKDTSNQWVEANQNWVDDFANASDGISDAADSLSDSADEFKETINWIEVLFTRIDNTLAEHEAYLTTVVDSTGGIAEKDVIYNTMFGQMYNKASYSVQAAKYYQQLADSVLSGMDQVVASKVRNGTILIEEITDEALKENIDKALDYLDQASQYKQQYYSTLDEIASKALERQNEASTAYENEIGLVEHLNDTLEARNDLLATKEGFAAEAYYKAQIDSQNKMLSMRQAERKELQRILDEEVALGHIQIGDQQWFDMQEAIYDCDDTIIDTEASIEDLQNAINDLYWDRFDELINRFGYLEDEMSNVIQLLSHDPDGLVMEELKDLTTTNWATGSGLASLGLYAQQMEEAQYVANQYAEQIKELKKQYAGRYNETEYLNKLNELINAQYENIEQYYDAKNAIIELNEARVDAIKDGINAEIDAYDELIQKKKELLNREQD